jgi:hypothetical protein
MLIAFCRVCYFWQGLVAPIWQAWGYGHCDEDGNPLPGFRHWYECAMQTFLHAILAAVPSACAQFVCDYWHATRPWDEYMRLTMLAMEPSLKRFRKRNADLLRNRKD